jgi:iron complex transport system permease protein
MLEQHDERLGVAPAVIAPAGAVRARGLPPVWTGCAVLFLVGSVLFALTVGPVSIPAWAIARSALAQLPLLHVHSPLGTVDEAIVWQRAGLGATVVIAYTGAAGGELLPVAAFGGAAVGVACAYVLGHSVGSKSSAGALILAGVCVAAFMTAGQTFVQQQHAQTLDAVYDWLLGGFGGASWHDVALAGPYIIVSAAILVAHRRLLDVLSLGDEEAASLGVNVRRVRLVVVVAATVGTAAAVAVSGLIGFVGIIVPHTIRLLVSTSYRAIVPLSLLVGAGFLVLSDVIARTVSAPAELPIGVVTAFFGAPFFAVVLRTVGRSGGP